MKKTALASVLEIVASSGGMGIVAACGGTSSSSTGGTHPGPDATIPVDDGQAPVLVMDSGPIGNLMQDGGPGAPDTGIVYGCTGLQCQIDLQCPDGGSTTVTGTVYDPAGKNPLYNVVVYVPNTTPSALKAGASCDSCASLYTGTPIAAAVTDAKGNFTMTNVPSGASIPLVIQIGKWRRQTTIPSVAQCGSTPITTKLMLPSNQSQGDIPSIAISTGDADSLECLLLRIGIDPSEYGAGASGPGRIHIFQGSALNGTHSAEFVAPDGGLPTTPASSQALWSSLATLMPYDITILSCEGQETEDSPRPDGGVSLTPSDQQILLDYANAGGRVFTSHYHYAWFSTGPFAAENIASWTPGANPINEANNNPVTAGHGDWINANIITTLSDGGPFVKGLAMNEWLSNTGSLGTGDAPGELHINGAKDNATLAGLSSTPSQAWIAADNESQGEVVNIPPNPPSGTAYDAGGATQYLSFNTPVEAGVDDAGAPDYCGRVVYSDLHVGAASEDYINPVTHLPQFLPLVPSECGSMALSPQEKALEFMLFDLSSCVTQETGNGMARREIMLTTPPMCGGPRGRERGREIKGPARAKRTNQDPCSRAPLSTATAS